MKANYMPLIGGTDHKMAGDMYMAEHAIQGLADPSRAADAANKRYVNAQIAAIQETIDTDLMEQAILKAKPPGAKFMYQSGSSGLNDMHFQYYSSNTKMRISAKGVDIDWLSEGPRVDYMMENGPYFTIYHMPNLATPSDRPKWKVRKTGRIQRIDWHENDILCYITSQESSSTNFGDGASYYITIGGIL